jgi:hypothetical protein
MFGRRRAALDTSLFEQVSDNNEVSLGTYPEAVLMVTGVGRLEPEAPRPDSSSPFGRLDEQGRNAAMQTALDELIGNGTIDLPTGTTVKTALAAKAGKLPVTGELGAVCGLIPVLRQSKGMVIAELTIPGASADGSPDGSADGDEAEALPLEVEFGYTMPFGAAASTVLLVERPDFATGARSYTLRTLRAELGRIADLLFGDAPLDDALSEGQPVHAEVRMVLSTKGGVVTISHSLTRSPGEEQAGGTMIVGGATGFGKIPEKKTDDVRLTRDEFVKLLLVQYVRGTPS